MKCDHCYGTGRDFEHRQPFVRLVRDCDHLHCSIHGDIGWHFKHGDCPECLGSGKST